MSSRRSNWQILTVTAAAAAAAQLPALANSATNKRSTEKVVKTSASQISLAPAAGTIEMQALRVIDSAIRKLRAGFAAEAEIELLAARSLSPDAALRATWNSVFSEVKESRGQWIDAAVHAQVALHEYQAAVAGGSGRNSGNVWNMASRRLLVRSIRNFFLAGLPGEAFVQFDRYKADLSKEFLSSDESLLFKRLSDELRRVNRVADALAVERITFRFYPFVGKHLLENLTPDTVCRLDETVESAADKRSRASLLLQRFGMRSDIMNYAQSLAGVPLALRLAQENPDTLSGQMRSELLDVVEWLQSARDYQTAIAITDRLIQSQNFEPPLTRERLVMVHARNLNGVHRPTEAAAFYRSLIMQYPQTDIANTARPRYVLSLHYAGQYADVAREASTLSGILRPKDVLWRTFWARYLSKQYSLAISSTAHESGDEQRARLQYWRGRAHEAEGHQREAKNIFTRIAAMENSNHYALFAAWRMQPPAVQPVSLQRGGVAFAARSLTPAQTGASSVLRKRPKFEDRFEAMALLADAGHADLLRAPLRKKLNAMGASADSLAEFLVYSGDAHASVQFATQQRRSSGKIPVGRNGEWSAYLAKNSANLRMLYPLPYREVIADAADAFQISPWLILSIMRAESLFQPQVVSNVGARGLMQIMPTTGERIAELIEYPDFEPSHLDQPKVNIAFGSWYLARLLEYYRGQLPLAIAAYNAGPEAIDRWLSKNSSMYLDEFLEDIPFDQTRKYVATVLTNMEIYSRLYSNGKTGIEVNLSLALPTPRNDMEMF
ncbi:MAG: hypothetical protein RLZZ488_592 [Pseudomonadota bacterium]